MRHRCTSVRYVDEEGRVTDIVQCVNCGLTTVWTGVDLDTRQPLELDADTDCAEWLVRSVMES